MVVGVSGRPYSLTKHFGTNEWAPALVHPRRSRDASRHRRVQSYAWPLLDFQLALYIFNDWCIGANVADDIVPNGLGLAGCNANDARQLWDLW